jgi:hypothetical protein
MATRADCVKAALAGGLDKAAAARVVDDLFAARRKIEADRAAGKVANAEADLAAAWTRQMDEERVAALIRRKQTAINIMRRSGAESFIKGVRDQGGTALDAIEAMLVGSNKRFTGARDSIDAARTAIKRDLWGAFINDLESLERGTQGRPLRELMRTKDFQAEVVREVSIPGSTENASARAVAEVIARHLEKSRLRLNAAGASIGRLEGYLPHSHDPFLMTEGTNSRADWIAFIENLLDAEKSFGEKGLDRAEKRRILNDVYDNIILGKEGTSNAEKGLRTGPANLASRLGRHRVLHFKNADAYLAYHERYSTSREEGKKSGAGYTQKGMVSHKSPCICDRTSDTERNISRTAP